ncbi:choline kinase [Stylonychia lemnae]|uniref:Choline kinase n=1 Tax=Stylonychia lemnae TaxID=5949 RepID=A0A077ZZ25_STYLE|nr:choline kinase [Stylonychia lemnae]|eukprot:CDW75206.1 choline kinase [Stylonychia lemnae]
MQSRQNCKNIEPKTIFLKFFHENPYVNRALEIDIFSHLSNQGKVPKLIYQGTEYRIEEYISGRQLTVFELRNRTIYNKVAEFLCNLHYDFSLRQIADEHLGKNQENIDPKKYIEQYSKQLRDQVLAIKNYLQTHQPVDNRLEILIQFEEIFLPVDIVERYINTLNQLGESISYVLTHNDIQECNILAKDENNLNFYVIDYEYATFAPRSMDLANYINETVFENTYKCGSGANSYGRF